MSSCRGVGGIVSRRRSVKEYLEYVPEAEGHLADGFLGWELRVAEGRHQDGVDQSQHRVLPRDKYIAFMCYIRDSQIKILERSFGRLEIQRPIGQRGNAPRHVGQRGNAPRHVNHRCAGIIRHDSLLSESFQDEWQEASGARVRGREK